MKFRNTAIFLIASMMMQSMPAAAELFGDIDGSGTIDSVDAAWILQYAAYTGAGGTSDLHSFVNGTESGSSYTAERYGSAVYIDGKTLVISIFSDDPETSWNMGSDEDLASMARTQKNLQIATDWLTEQTAAYGANAEFLYNWTECPDLVYYGGFSVLLEKDDYTYTESVYPAQQAFIEENIPSQELLAKYDADNIIYMFFINSDYSNQANPVTAAFCHDYGTTYYTDHINLCIRFDDYYDTSPAAYAHEMLHCFGAPDLYYENNDISQAYVDHCEYEWLYNNAMDIMYTVNDGDVIECEFTELDAYYVGITERSEDVETWGLGVSDYLIP